MGSYVESTLTPDEQVIYRGEVSFWLLLTSPWLLLGLLLFSVSWKLGLLFLVFALVKYAITYFTTELAITNKRIIAKFGFIGRSTIEMGLNKVESIRVIQGILARIFNYGSIIVSGAGNPQVPIPGISDPMRFRQVFVSLQEGK